MPIKKNKKNLFLSSYLETKLLLYSVIILEFNKLEELERCRLIQETEIRQKNLQDQLITEVKNEEILSSTPILNINQSTVYNSNIDNISPIVTIDSLTTELQENLKNLNSENRTIWEKYSKYRSLFNNFDWSSKLNDQKVIFYKIKNLLNSDFLKNGKSELSVYTIINSFIYVNLLNFYDNNFFLNFLKNYSNNFKSLTRLMKKKKWRLKKRKLKKLKIFRKLKKIMIHKKLKNHSVISLHSFVTLWSKCKDSEDSILLRKIPLTKKVINDSNLELFYKLNKNIDEQTFNSTLFLNLNTFNVEEEFTLYLRNYHQKPYWKLRQSRVSHWNFFFSKTLRKHRYKKFIDFYVKKYDKFGNIYQYLSNYFTGLSISWSRMSRFNNLLKKNLSIKLNSSVLILPMFNNKYIDWQILKKKNYKIKKKIAKWSYLNYKRYTFPWLQKKKNFPKAVKHIFPKFYYFKKISQFDPFTNYLYLSENLKNYSIPFYEQFKVNFLIKLHMYRYKSNNICLLLY